MFSSSTNRVIRISIFVALAVSCLVLGIYLPVLLNLKGYSSSEIGILMGMISVAGTIGPICIGLILQSTAKYRLVVVLSAVMSMFFLTLIWSRDNFIFNVVLLFCYGLFYASFITMLESIITVFLYNPHKEYGIVRVMMSMGYLTATLILGIYSLVDIKSDYSIFKFGLFVFSLVIVSSLIFIPSNIPEDLEPSRVEKQNIFFDVSLLKSIHPSFYILLIFGTLNFMGQRTIDTFIVLVAVNKFQIENITVLFSIAVTSEMLVIYFGQRIIDKIGYNYGLLCTLLGTSTRLLLIGFAQNIWWLYSAQTFHALSFGGILSIYVHFINRVIKRQNKSIAMALFQTSLSLATIVASITAGYLIDYFDYFNAFKTMAVFPILGIISLSFFYKKLEWSTVYELKQLNR